MKRVRCPGCRKFFATPQALGSHQNWCKKLLSQPASDAVGSALEKPNPVPIVPTRVSSAVEVSREKWNPGWSDEEKKRHLFESLPLAWGIGRRQGVWQPIPVVGGMSYAAAAQAADRRIAIDRFSPPRPYHPVQSQVDEDGTSRLMALFMMMLSND